MKQVILFFFILNPSHLACAEVQQIALSKNKLKVLKLPSWQKVEGFHGGDITWIGPKLTGPRPVIKLDYVNKKSWNFKEEKKSVGIYLTNKREWIKSKEGTLEKYKLGKQSSLIKFPHLYNQVQYQLAGQNYIEQDWLIKCPQALFNLSFLVTPVRYQILKQTWSKFLRTFKCL